MNRRTAIRYLATFFLTAASLAQAQQTGKIFRIGFLDPSDARTSAVRLKPFWEEIGRLGWIEGKNIAVEYRFTEEKNDRLPELAADLVRLKVDVIVTTSTGVALAAKKATTTIPIVMTNSADPVAAGLVASLARPGGNVTGMSSLTVELNTKRLEVIKDAVPKLARVGLLRVENAGVAEGLQVKELRLAAAALKLKLEEIEIKRDPKALESAFKSAKQKQVGAIMPIARPLFAERKRIVEFAVKYRLPAIYPQKEYVDEGGLMYYGVYAADGYRRAAHHVDKILKGTKPSDIPVEQAMRTEFIISLKAAKQIGITLPYELLARANQVIK
jgi:putative ABC transport system substrate-binding protein